MNNNAKSINPSCKVVRIEDVAVREHDSTKPLPATYDLSDEVTQPVNQGSCGSCWAITTTQCLRDRINRHRRQHGRKHGDVPPLSYQFVMDCACGCVTYKGRRGCALDCQGGFMVASFSFLYSTGTPSAEFHPSRFGHANDADGSTHVDGTSEDEGRDCPVSVPGNEPLFKCQGYYNVNLYDTFGIVNARAQNVHLPLDCLRRNADNIAREILKHGPVSACFNLFSDFSDFWDHPRSKHMVYRIGWQLPQNERDSLDPVGNVKWTKRSGPRGIHFKTSHSVSIVGFGTQKLEGVDVPYWICRNSWGQPRHTYNGGFFKIRRGFNDSAIEGDVAAPVVTRRVALAMMPAPSTALPGRRPTLFPQAAPQGSIDAPSPAIFLQEQARSYPSQPLSQPRSTTNVAVLVLIIFMFLLLGTWIGYRLYRP